MSNTPKHSLLPMLRFPEFEGEWKTVKIGDITQVSTGGTPESTNPEYWNGEIPWMNSGELNYRKIYSVSNFITEKGYNESSTRLIPIRCILVGLAGQGKTRGTAAINYIELCINQSIAAIYPNIKLFLSEFLYYKIDSLYKKLRNLSDGGSGRGGLNLQIIKSIEISLPSLAEQQRIAACLSFVDNLITAEGQKLEVLQAYKKGLLQQLFPTPGQTLPALRFPEFADAGEWEEKALGDLLEFKNGINAQKEQYGKGIKFINVLDILNNEYITYEKIIGRVDVSDNLLESFSVNYGDILFQRSSETQEEVGTANVYIDKNYTAVFGGFVIRGKKIGEYDPLFLNNFLKVQYIRQNISSKAGGSTRFNIGQEALSSTNILLPSPAEQQKIADCLSSADALIEAQRRNIEALKQHKKGLMQQLFPAIDEA